MKSPNYDKLMEKITVSNEVEQYNVINRRIDEILANSYDREESLRALICLFEAKCNQSVFYTLMSICFALLIGIFSIIPKDFTGSDGGVLWILVGLFVVTVLVFIASQYANSEEERKTFVLNILRMRYDEIQHNETNQEENSKTYVVTVKTK